MNKRVIIKKGAEPALILPALVYLLGLIGQEIDVELSPESAAAIAGFLYGVYRSIRNFFKNRKR